MNFFNCPWKFSFKDLMAAVFIGSFLYFCLKSLASNQALELVKSLVSLVGIILGGYFVQEGAAMYFQRSQGTGLTRQQQYNAAGQSLVTADYLSPEVTPEKGEIGQL